VWSTTDKHGYSQHGDYVFGWKGDALQKALDNRCNGDVCKQIGTQSPEEAAKCTIERAVREDIDGCRFAREFAFIWLLLTVPRASTSPRYGSCRCVVYVLFDEVLLAKFGKQSAL